MHKFLVSDDKCSLMNPIVIENALMGEENSISSFLEIVF